ncbi:MAG: ABC transporter ATP-binding protein [Candidatus Paceibacterota bacterium]|jgi:ABC-type multidrug transport system fused ATPase/permease subunit
MKKYFEITKRLWKLLKPFHKYFYGQFFFTISLQLISIISTFIISKIIDNSISKSWNFVYIYFSIYFLLLVIQRIFNNKSANENLKKSYGYIQQFLEEFSFKKILNLNTSQYIEDHSAIRMKIVDDGESATQRILETLILSLLPVILNFLFSILIISFYSKILSIISIFTIIVVIYANYRFTNFFRPLQRKSRDQKNEFKKVRVEGFEHLKLIKLLSIEDIFLVKYLEKRLINTEYFIKIWLLNNKFVNIRQIFLSSIQFISLVISIILFARGQITIGIVYSLFSWISSMYSQLWTINSSLRQLPSDYLDLEKYLDVIDMKPDFDEEGENKFKAGDIEFKNIDFKYPKGDKNVLHDLSFHIKEGTKVAFVGYSGSGKTTIVQLLLRAYDYNSGEIKINGVDLKDMSANSLRENIGYVEQHVDLFDDTIKENILFGVKDLSKLKNVSGHTRSKKITSKIANEDINNALEEIARKARIDQFYHRLGEKKFETMIGERGIKLSGGERQRVGIARALIKNPAILIFDEATSALDAENEKYIKEAIEEASIGRTTIIIAHRLSTVKDVDQIFMMSHGKIIAQGTHDELLEKSKEYRELVEAQMN